MAGQTERKGPFLDLSAKFVLDYVQNNMEIPEGTLITPSNIGDVLTALDFVRKQNPWMDPQYRLELKLKKPKDLEDARKHLGEKQIGRFSRFLEMVNGVIRFNEEFGDDKPSPES